MSPVVDGEFVCDPHLPGVPTPNHPDRDKTCARCGRRITAPQRDPDFEAGFLEDVERVVHQIQGISYDPAATVPFYRLLHARLEMGEERYGDRWAREDSMPEAAEEKPDAVAYYMLELQRQKVLGRDAEELQAPRAKLATAAAHLAIADVLARSAHADLQAP